MQKKLLIIKICMKHPHKKNSYEKRPNHTSLISFRFCRVNSGRSADLYGADSSPCFWLVGLRHCAPTLKSRGYFKKEGQVLLKKALEFRKGYRCSESTEHNSKKAQANFSRTHILTPVLQLINISIFKTEIVHFFWKCPLCVLRPWIFSPQFSCSTQKRRRLSGS